MTTSLAAYRRVCLPFGVLAFRVTWIAAFVLAFAAGSTWAAFSGTVGVLIAARASMGIGAALIMPSTLAIITHTFTDRRERQRALGFWAGTTGAGVALGPIVGGLLLARPKLALRLIRYLPIATFARTLLPRATWVLRTIAALRAKQE